MKMKPHSLNGEIANDCGHSGIAICFKDASISQLFAELLASCGVTATLYDSVTELPRSTRIVTEPRFFNQLTAEQAKNCLIVGPKKSLRDIKARCLEQPLTEEGVEAALEYLSQPG
jgi:hypothetical protein